ncbi:MAG: hypothetical protein JRG91_14820, partial [Deltaproteobacteria bacterium]|nr:hypothetical protein [Deltaproteobacteria bacterium]
DCNGCSASCWWERALLVPSGETGAVVSAGGGTGTVCLGSTFTFELWFRLDEPLTELYHLALYQPESFGVGFTRDRFDEYQVVVVLCGELDPGVSFAMFAVEQAIAPGDWHHVAVTSRYEGGTGGVYVYAWFDGSRLEEWWPRGGAWRCESDLHLGYAGVEDWAASFSGAIDDVRISSRNIYPSIRMTPESRLEPTEDTVALWTLDHSTAGVVADATGGGRDAELAGGSLVLDQCHGSP